MDNRKMIFEAFRIFIGLKQHFTTDNYDYIKYKGKSRVTQESLDKRHDKYQFNKIAKKYKNQRDIEDYIIANLLEGKEWIGDFSEDNLISYIKRRQSLVYLFANDLDVVFANKETKSPFKILKSEYPDIILLFLQGKISLETLVILNRFTSFVEIFDSKLSKSDVIWSKIRRKIIKYTPFLEYDKEKMKNILKEKAFSA
jgi:hypothetical protein